MIRDFEKAYSACALDAEGSISISSDWQLRVNIGNTEIRFLEYVQSFFGGAISTVIRGHRIPYHVLYWSAKDAVEVLKVLKEFMTIKKHKATLAIIYYETMIYGRVNRTKLTQDEIDARQAFKEAVSENYSDL